VFEDERERDVSSYLAYVCLEKKEGVPYGKEEMRMKLLSLSYVYMIPTGMCVYAWTHDMDTAGA